jgi:hypothetical protein
MTAKYLLVAAVASLMATAAIPARALDVSVGGVSVSAGSDGGGGTSVSVGGGDTSAGVSIGGGDNVASVGASTGGTGASVGIGNTSGDLVTLNGTDANVNLGGLGLGSGVNDALNGITGPLGDTLDGIDLGGLPGGGGGGGAGGGGGGVTAGGLVSAYGSLSSRDQQALRIRCRSVLNNPGVFTRSQVALCSLLARL